MTAGRYIVRRLLFPAVGEILGPAEIAYADASTFRPSRAEGCRELTEEDSEACLALAATLSAAERAQSGFDPQAGMAFGSFAGGKLCAIASYAICLVWYFIVYAKLQRQRRLRHRA